MQPEKTNMSIEVENPDSSPGLTGQKAEPPRAEAGQTCPVCGLGIMDYDGLLNVVCPVCGFTQGGCFT